MRFMLLVKADKNSEASVMPPKELFAEMGKFNEEMAKAGVMLAGEGLHPTSKGARISYGRGKPTVTDGPFPGAKDLVAGFWLIQVKSKRQSTGLLAPPLARAPRSRFARSSRPRTSRPSSFLPRMPLASRRCATSCSGKRPSLSEPLALS